MEDYRRRLIEWNNTSQYRNELAFLCHLLYPTPKDRVLDYGCGTGIAVKWLRSVGVNTYGYDVSNYVGDTPDWYKDYFSFQFTKMYFMHSLAHIEFPSAILDVARSMLMPKGRIYVITPNADWLTFKNEGKAVKTDPTVFSHFSSMTLEKLFVDSGYKIVDQGQFGSVLMNQHERLFIVAEA
jgi:2-polyprenyl-3-methyl-5-hydroxy-6-metoxy-1,4-benzoquinol methylase